MFTNSFCFIFIKVSVHSSDISKQHLSHPQHVLQRLRRECFGPEQPWARSNLYKITSILNVLIHQNGFKAGPKPINSTELETYRCQLLWLQLPTSEVEAFCVWLYPCSSIFQRESAVTQHTYQTPFPNKNLAHNIWKLPARPLPVFHSRHYSYHESFFLQGVSHREHSSRSAGISKLYSKSCCQETKTSFRTSKATISYTVFRIWTSTHGTGLHW